MNDLQARIEAMRDAQCELERQQRQDQRGKRAELRRLFPEAAAFIDDYQRTFGPDCKPGEKLFHRWHVDGKPI